MAGTITRGKLLRSDVANWDGKTATATRIDATGGTITGLAVGNEVDVLQVYGSGTDRTRSTIVDATNFIGTSNVTLVFAPGTWTVDSDLTIGANFTCHIPAGCVFSVSSGVTLTFSGDVLTDDPDNWYTGAGTVVVSREGSHGGVWHRTAAERTAGVTPTNFGYPSVPAPPERYGYTGANLASDTTALQDWASVAAPRALLDKTYQCDDRLTFVKNASVIGKGSGVSIIDFSGATGTFTGTQAISFSEGELVALPATTGDPAEGATQLTFASAHGLAEGDIIVLHDDTSSSWSGFNANYTAGEMCVVSEVVSSTVVGLLEPLYDGYTSASTNCFQLDHGTCHLEGFGVKGVSTDSAVIPIFISHCAHSRIRDVKATGSAGTAITIRYSYDIDVDVTAHQYYEGTEVGTSQYGVSIIHCQDVRVSGHCQGERHAVTTGSSTGDGGIVNRGIIISGSMKSLISDAVDFHGNTEWSAIDGCLINGGVALGGDNNALRNSHVTGNSAINAGQPIRFREMLGFNFEISNVSCRTLANPIDTGGTGVVDMGGNVSTTLTSNTTRAGTLRISNLHLDAPNATGGIRLVNRGCTQNLDVVINGYSPRLSGSTTASFGYLRLDDISGGNFRSVVIDAISNPDRHPLSSTFDVDDGTIMSFTPALAFGGGSTGVTYSHQVGRCEVRGDVVHFWLSILLTSKGTDTGAATVTGLPFTALTVGNLPYPCIVQAETLTFSTIPSAIVSGGGTSISLQEFASGGSLSTITDADFADTTRIRILGFYRRA